MVALPCCGVHMEPAPPLWRDICPRNTDLAFVFPALLPAVLSASLPSALLFHESVDLWGFYLLFTAPYTNPHCSFSQSSDMGVKQKSELNSRLEEKTNQMAATIKQLEQR